MTDNRKIIRIENDKSIENAVQTVYESISRIGGLA